MGLFKKKKPSMEDSSVEVIEKEIKSYKPWSYFLLVEYILLLLIGVTLFIFEALHYCTVTLLFVVIALQALGMLRNRVQYLRFLVYVKKGEK